VVKLNLSYLLSSDYDFAGHFQLQRRLVGSMYSVRLLAIDPSRDTPVVSRLPTHSHLPCNLPRDAPCHLLSRRQQASPHPSFIG